MSYRKVEVAGAKRLNLVTRLLQRARLVDPMGGVWEAADVHWWSRVAGRSEEKATPVWLDQRGPTAAVLVTDWTTGWGIDVLRVPRAAPAIDAIWFEARRVVDSLGGERCDSLVREDDDELVTRLVASGFAPGSRAWQAWMAPADRMPPSAVPAGYRVVDRATSSTGPHPMARRGGQEVEDRLRRCSLYDPALDLAVQANNGEFAGYALFWADPVTRVGLVEPMRVEDAHARRGLARAMLTEGLERLLTRGMTRLKVGFETDAARALYMGVGFRPAAPLRNYTRGDPHAL